MKREYIINTTFIVEPPVHGQWYEFIIDKFLPYVKEKGFSNLIFTRVLTNDKNSHYTYSLQIPDSTIQDYERYMKECMTEYSNIAGPWFAEKAMHYVSMLKLIDTSLPTKEKKSVN